MAKHPVKVKSAPTAPTLDGINLLVPAPLAQAIVTYLQRQPYGDVHQLIAAMLQCGNPHTCIVPEIPPAE